MLIFVFGSLGIGATEHADGSEARVHRGPLVTMIVLFIVSYIAYSEFSYLIDKIYSYSHINHLIRHGVILFYCLIIFWITTFILITNIYDFIFVLSICIFTDVGGYIVGKTIKGPKLTKISPNKTYAGMLGSFICSLIICTIFIIYFNFSINFIFFTLLISLVSVENYSVLMTKMERDGNFV